jgi:1-acyl-sn-glycerol-3-phosphate acyltransferase
LIRERSASTLLGVKSIHPHPNAATADSWAPSDDLLVHDGAALGAFGVDPRHFDPASLEPVLRRFDRLFGPDGPWPAEQQGAESIPEPPVLLASNHSGGVMIPDAWALGYVWYRTLGTERPLTPLGHELPFRVPPIARAFARLGGMKATPGAAVTALKEHGRDALVMPGGDVDVFRPYSDRYRVCFGGHRGYARVALEAGVPVVPVANSGPHATLVVLRRGERLAKAMGLERLRAHSFPIALTVPWGLTVGPWPHLPLPARFRYRFGAPISLPSTFLRRRTAAGAPTDEAIDALDQLVQAEMQRLLDELRAVTPGFGERLRRGLRA